MNRRNNILSVPVNREELKAFNKCRSMAEDEKDNRISNAKFIRDYILLPYLKNNPYIEFNDMRNTSTDKKEETSIEQDSKPESELKSELGKYAFMLDDL